MEAYIAGGVRTAIGRFNGSMASLNASHMGITAENVAEKYRISRKEQDEFAAASQKKTEQTIKEGKFKDEIVPLKIKQQKGEDKLFDK